MGIRGGGAGKCSDSECAGLCRIMQDCAWNSELRFLTEQSQGLVKHVVSIRYISLANRTLTEGRKARPRHLRLRKRSTPTKGVYSYPAGPNRTKGNTRRLEGRLQMGEVTFVLRQIETDT